MKKIVSLLLVVFLFTGFSGLSIVIRSAAQVFWLLLLELNEATVKIYGITIWETMINSTLTFFAVGCLLEALNIPRGKFGFYFGKISFWLIGYPISFVTSAIFSFLSIR